MSLTKSQQKVFEFLVEFIQINGFPPSYSDIASAFQFSSDGTVRTYLDQLEKKGFIKRVGKARGIQILKPLVNTSIPIVGVIAAGKPIMSDEHFIGSIQDLPGLQPDPRRFSLKIRGNSMIDAGIMDGDYVIIQKQSTIDSNQIGAVSIDDELTLKRVIFHSEAIELKAENQDFPSIMINAKELSAILVGKLVSVVRNAV